jgi:hypothetical protein
MRRFVLSLCISLLLTLSFSAVNPVEACSGAIPPGNFPLDFFLDLPSGTLAMGDVNTVSESGINAVITVYHYLREPQEEGILLLSRARPEVIDLVESGRPYPTRCANLSRPIESGRHFIGNFIRAENGSYYGYLVTSDEDGIFRYYLRDQPEQLREFSYAELRLYLENRLSVEASEPEQFTYPRAVEVRLVTQTGEKYLLPVDQTTLVQIELASDIVCNPYVGTECTSSITAPNGIDTAYFYPLGSGAEENTSVDMLYLTAFEGETGVFSQRSDLLAVWTGNMLRLFATHSQYGLNTTFAYSPTLLASYTALPDDPLLTGAGAWNPNGRVFAFSTRSGVWLWDLLSPNPQPVLFLSAVDEPVRVRHYSPLGNYLALETGTRRYYRDNISGLEYPDGSFSPDDRLLAAYDTAASALTPTTLYMLMPQLSPARGWNNFQVEITQFEWITSTHYIFAACGEPFADAELQGFDQPWCKVRSLDANANMGEWFDGTAFDYEPVTNSLGILVDGDTILINGEQIDFSGQLNGQIVGLEQEPLIDLNYQHLDG